METCSKISSDKNRMFRNVKIGHNKKGSGLFSVLPKPRHEFLATPRQMCSSTCPLTPQNIKSKAKTTNPSDPDEHHFDEKKEEENFFTIPDRKSDTLEVVADKTIEEYLKPIVQHETKASKCSNHEDIACISHTEIEMPCHASSTPIELNNDVPLTFTYHMLACTGRYVHLYYIAIHFPHEAEWAP
ncbi:hypothetical protein M8J77_025746 [Diaphorina citri]|nr:hypothetical protein M8J77_025746 [Diaphorina citri]